MPQANGRRLRRFARRRRFSRYFFHLRGGSVFTIWFPVAPTLVILLTAATTSSALTWLIIPLLPITTSSATTPTSPPAAFSPGFRLFAALLGVLSTRFALLAILLRTFTSLPGLLA